MSTCNFTTPDNNTPIFALNDGKGIYSSYNDDDGIIYQCCKDDFLNEFETSLNHQGRELAKSSNYDYLITDKKGRIAGAIDFLSGYYDGVQIYLYKGRDIYNDMIESGETYVNKDDFNFNYKRVINDLRKITTCLDCVGIFLNGEAIYKEI